MGHERDDEQSGQPARVLFLSRSRGGPPAGPYILYGGKTDYSHLCRADRFLHVWLEHAGYDFDVISDIDLHREPEMLRGYRVFVINGHSEYWSLSMYYGLERYLASDGNVICLSGKIFRS